MALWTASDANTGAPKFAIFGGIGVSANGNVLFSNTQVNAFHANVGLGANGVTTTEKSAMPGPAHSGWVKEMRCTGYVTAVAVTNGGTGYTPGPGWITFTGGGTANSLANALFQVNAAGSIANVTVTPGVAGANYTSAPTANAAVAYSTPATFTVSMSAKTGVIKYETLVATGSLV
jgi:hypothetical protein